MDEIKITSIMVDRDHDQVMVNQFRDEIKALEMKIEYYKGKIDATNDILEKLEIYA